MRDCRPLNAMASLEEARAQLEIVLRPDAHWRALAQATLPAHRAALERALADNPVFHAWKLVGQSIEAMQAEGGADRAAAMPSIEPQASARPPRIELRQVLDRIRSETPFDAVEAPTDAAAGSDDDPAAPGPAPAFAPPHIEVEEATITFIVREPATAASAATTDPGVATQSLETPHLEASTGSGAPASDADDETEVTIVQRRR